MNDASDRSEGTVAARTCELLDYSLWFSHGEPTVEGWEERIRDIPPDVLRETIVSNCVLHNYVGANAHDVKLELVRYVLTLAPDAAREVDSQRGVFGYAAHPLGGGSCALNIACFNANCPVSVIKLLLERYPAAIRHSWTEGYGLPLNCYLARSCRHQSYGHEDEDGNYQEELPSFPTGKVEIDTVRMLVEAFPEALTDVGCRRGYTPMHTLCIGRDVSLKLAQLLTDVECECLKIRSNIFEVRENKQWDYLPIGQLLYNRYVDVFPTDVFRYLLKRNPTSFDVEGNDEDSVSSWDFKDAPLHVACSNPKISLDAVQLIINSCPGMIKEEIKYSGLLPLHALCKNEDLEEQTSLQLLFLLLKEYPESVKRRAGSNIKHLGWVNEYHGELPIQIAEKHMSFEFCKILLSARALVSSLENVSRLQIACFSGCSLELVKKLVEEDPELLWSRDGDGHLALHSSCSGGASPEVIRYLVDGNEWSLRVPDGRGDLAFHKACRKGDLPVIEYLMAKDLAPLSVRNHSNELPVFILCNNSHKSRRTLRSVGYVETIFKLIKAYPETVGLVR